MKKMTTLFATLLLTASGATLAQAPQQGGQQPPPGGGQEPPPGGGQTPPPGGGQTPPPGGGQTPPPGGDQAPPPGQGDAPPAFGEVDANDDDAISSGELAAAGLNINMQEADSNGDGMLDRNEFNNAVRGR